jgi:hypothetical protein
MGLLATHLVMAGLDPRFREDTTHRLDGPLLRAMTLLHLKTV